MAARYFILIFLIFIGDSLVANAQDQRIDSDAHYIFGNVMSPFCPGRLLNDCPSEKAGQLKQDIREMLAKGKSKDAIFSELISTYGEAARAAPQKKGFGLLAYLAPLFFLGLGFVIVRLVAKTSIASDAAPPGELDPEAERKISELLK